MTKYYSQLIADIFTKGDARYSEEYKEFAIYFLKNNAVTVEAKEVSHLMNNIPLPKEVLEIEGPQQSLKRLVLSIFQEFGVELIGFERNVGYGRVDILGRLRDKQIFVECGPCRIDKCFNYLREDNIELWLVDAWLESSAKEQAMLYIIRQGPNWQKVVEKYDAHKLSEIKKVKSPLDSL